MMLKGRSKINCGQVDKLVRGLGEKKFGDGVGEWSFDRKTHTHSFFSFLGITILNVV